VGHLPKKNRRHKLWVRGVFKRLASRITPAPMSHINPNTLTLIRQHTSRDDGACLGSNVSVQGGHDADCQRVVKSKWVPV
jgi:hypothetical protein